MRKISLFITSSIDGYIATPDGDTDWLTEYPNLERLDYGYKKFLSKIDTVLMGGNTYRSLLSMDIIWPYEAKTTYIISYSPVENIVEDNIHCITENIISEISAIKEKNGSNIGLVGGGELTKLLLQADLIDEMIISTVPILLGDGIPLFPPYYKLSKWRIEESKCYKNGLLQAVYRKISY